MSVHAHADARGFAIRTDLAMCRCDDPCLHRVPRRSRNRLLVGEAQVGECRSARNSKLRCHEVDSGDLLGDGVLDLDASISLDEEVLSGLWYHEELHGSGVGEVGGLGQPHSVGRQPISEPSVQVRRGSNLQHLLVSDLNRAIAFVKVHDRSPDVPKDLYLDVTRVHNEPLNEDFVGRERCASLAAAPFVGRRHFAGGVHDPHPTTATARSGFQHDGVAEASGEGLGLVGRRHGPVASWNCWDTLARC